MVVDAVVVVAAAICDSSTRSFRSSRSTSFVFVCGIRRCWREEKNNGKLAFRQCRVNLEIADSEQKALPVAHVSTFLGEVKRTVATTTATAAAATTSNGCNLFEARLGGPFGEAQLRVR